MDGCQPASPYAILSEDFGTFGFIRSLVSSDAGMVCNARGTSFFIRGVGEPQEAWPIVRALRVFPKPLIERFLAGASIRVVDPKEFDSFPDGDAESFSKSMGVRAEGKQWYIRSDLLDPALKEKLARKIWYALASILADDLVGEKGFDRRRFQAEFGRYLTKRLGNVLVEPWLAVSFFLPGVDPFYQVYLDLLAEAPDFEPQTLRNLFREAVADFGSSKRLAGSPRRLMLGQSQPWNFRGLYNQFMDRGLALPMTTAQNITIDLQSAESRERPQSSHRAYVYYSNEIFDGWFSGAIAALVPSWKPKVSWMPGIAGSYETSTPNESEHAAIFFGSLLDVDLVPGINKWVFHSYLGVPLAMRVGGDDKKSQKPETAGPEWEIGLRREGAFFFGSMLSVPFFDPERRYMGLVMRWEE